MIPDERLEEWLTQHAVEWSRIPADQHFALESEWNRIYGNVWTQGQRHKRRARAQHEFLNRVADEFLIVPVLGKRAGPHGIGTPNPRRCAYRCRASNGLPNLAEFANLDFFIAPPDFSWTMLHTHEDYELGGPYFIDRSWLVERIP
jgi:hypothetical protein